MNYYVRFGGLCILSLLMAGVCLDAAATWNAELFKEVEFRRPLVAGNWMYFTTNANPDYTLWRTDGTVDGTTMVQVIASNCHYSKWVTLGGNTYFLTYDDGSMRLWKFVPGTGSLSVVTTLPDGYLYGSILVAENCFYFVKDWDLYKSDGTAEGTVVADEFINFSNFVCAVGDTAVYLDTFTGSWSRLYASDGTPEGTNLLGEYTDSFEGSEAGVVDGILYFSAIDATTEEAGLYKTDGTPAGTGLVKAMTATSIKACNGKGLFISGETDNEYVWSTDGTEAGTIQLHRIFSQPGLGNHTILGGNDYFPYFVEGVASEMWKTDGTPGGTVKVKDFAADHAAVFYSSPTSVQLSTRRLMLLIDTTALTYDLWHTDGTAAGTQFIREFAGFNQFYVTAEAPHGFFFSYSDPVYGGEPWFCDYTAAGTYLIQDIRPGTASSLPLMNVFFKNKLFFSVLPDGMMWVCEEDVNVCGEGERLVDDLAGFSDYVAAWFPELDTALAGLGMADYVDYDLENAHLAIGGAGTPDVGDGLPDWFELSLVHYVLCNESFWAHDIVETLYVENKALFQSDMGDLYGSMADERLLDLGTQFGSLIPAGILISSTMRDTLDGILAAGFGDTAAPLTVLPRVDQYGTCCGGAKVSGELFSALGDLDGDGILNIDEYRDAMAATGSAQVALLAVTDPGNFWPGNPEMPAAGLAGLVALAGTLAVASIRAVRRK